MKGKNYMKEAVFGFCLILVLSACTTIEPGSLPVNLGTWDVSCPPNYTGEMVITSFNTRDRNPHEDVVVHSFRGYFNWHNFGIYVGREYFDGTYEESDNPILGRERIVRLNGTRLDSNGLVLNILSEYTANVSADGNQLTGGTWRNSTGFGTWEAVWNR